MIARAKNPTVCWTSCRYRFRWDDGAAGVVDVAKTQFKRERRQAIEDLQGQTSIRASGRRGYPSLKCDDISEIRRSSSLPCLRSGYDRAVLHGVSGAASSPNRGQHHVPGRPYPCLFHSLRSTPTWSVCEGRSRTESTCLWRAYA